MSFLIIHIIFALAGLVVSGLAIRWPHSLITYAKILLLLTLFSGALLGLKAHASLTSLCLAGLIYTLFVAGLLVVAAYRLE